MQIIITAQTDSASIAPKSRFDFNTHREFRAAYEKVLNAGVKHIRLDLAQVDYLDSSALGMMLLLRDKAFVLGRQVEIINSSGSVRQILDVANFGQLFSIR